MIFRCPINSWYLNTPIHSWYLNTSYSFLIFKYPHLFLIFKCPHSFLIFKCPHSFLIFKHPHSFLIFTMIRFKRHRIKEKIIFVCRPSLRLSALKINNVCACLSYNGYWLIDMQKKQSLKKTTIIVIHWYNWPSFLIWLQQILEEGQRVQWPKLCGYNNQDEDHCFGWWMNVGYMVSKRLRNRQHKKIPSGNYEYTEPSSFMGSLG